MSDMPLDYRDREPTNGELLAAIERLRMDVVTRLDSHANQLRTIRDDVNRNTREEVRFLGEEVSAIGRQIMRLQSQVRELRGEA